MELGGRMNIFSNSIKMTQKSLDFLWKRQESISNNIANIDTPGYKAKLVSFEDNLKENIGKTRLKNGKRDFSQAIGKFDMEVKVNNSGSNRLDGNNVSLDAEFVEQARTGLHYQYATRAINDELMKLKSVIKGQ